MRPHKRRAVVAAFFQAIRSRAEAHKLLRREHFSVGGTLIEAAATLKSLRPSASASPVCASWPASVAAVGAGA